MASRTFVDAEGVTWQVWDVHPELAERRTAERRREAKAPPATSSDRRAAERRHRAEKRVSVRPGFENGWLAFDSPIGMRRLAPIPPEWTSFPDGLLAELCRQAMEGARSRRRLIE